MDFGKLKEGVIGLSAFLVGHAVWLGLTLFSLWCGLREQFAQAAADLAALLTTASQSQTASTLLDTYGLKPLLPTFALFVVVFILYAHRNMLERFGGFVPPELVTHRMPGLRDIGLNRWSYVLRRLGCSHSFADLRAVVEARYRSVIDSRWSRRSTRFTDAFNIFKSLAALNLVLTVVGMLRGTGWTRSLLLSFSFVFCAAIAAVLLIYHGRNNSFWAIEDVLRSILADNVGKERPYDEETNRLLDRELANAERFLKADSDVPVVGLSWSLPWIGNVRVIRESWTRSARRVNSNSD